MKILSLNVGEVREVPWRGKMVKTGIFKKPVPGPLTLGATDVDGDQVVDRRYHGGVDKACYLYGANHSAHWKELYPALDWSYGMMGENITVDVCDEDEIRIGSIYKVGSAVVQAVQPRQPCFKLGVKFGTQKILKQFIAYGHPGVYFRVLEEGSVNVGDVFEGKELAPDGVSIKSLFHALYEHPGDHLLQSIAATEVIPGDLREYIDGKYEATR
ncbi:MAG: MOSC domain-containing protein [Bacteroidota bacterium]